MPIRCQPVTPPDLLVAPIRSKSTTSVEEALSYPSLKVSRAEFSKSITLRERHIRRATPRRFVLGFAGQRRSGHRTLSPGC